jgi:hypothetical protein
MHELQANEKKPGTRIQIRSKLRHLLQQRSSESGLLVPHAPLMAAFRD